MQSSRKTSDLKKQKTAEIPVCLCPNRNFVNSAAHWANFFMVSAASSMIINGTAIAVTSPTDERRELGLSIIALGLVGMSVTGLLFFATTKTNSSKTNDEAKLIAKYSKNRKS